MGDRNINVRSITGLDPVQDIVCDRLDLQEKITINGSEPIALQFLGYDPTTKTTKYMTPTDTTYTAGTGISISGTTINCTVTNTTYTAGTGLTLDSYGNTFNITGGDLGTIDMIIRGSLSSTSSLVATGTVNFSNLPTSDPGVAGQLWDSYGTLKISSGP
jgi:hypothetical protein